MQRITDIARSIAILALGATLAACAGTAGGAQPTPAPTVDAARADEIASNAFAALNSGDYAAWSRDWSHTMKGAIDATAFRQFRDGIAANVGAYVSHGEPVLSSTQQGTYRWTFRVTFERGEASIAFAFFDGSAVVDGVFVN